MSLHEVILEIAKKNYTDRKATAILHTLVTTQDLEVKDWRSETALAFLFSKRHVSMSNARLVAARLLLEAGADVDVTNWCDVPLLVVSEKIIHTKLLLEGVNSISSKVGRIQLSLIHCSQYYLHIFVQYTFIHDVLIEAV